MAISFSDGNSTGLLGMYLKLGEQLNREKALQIKPSSKTNKACHQQLAKQTSLTVLRSDWFAVSHPGL